MNIRKIIAAFVAVAGITALAAGSANAQLVGFANAGGNNPAAGNYISYTPGNGGGLTLMTTNGFINGAPGFTLPVTINFGTLTNTPGSYIPPDPVTGAFSQGLNAGSFTITQGSTTLLSGTFGASTLTGNDTTPGGSPGTSASGGIQLDANSVTYTGGTYFDSSHFLANNGSLSITFKASEPIVATSTQIDSFFANDAITFSALPRTSTPEASSVVGLGIGLMGILGLCFLGMRRRANMTS